MARVAKQPSWSSPWRAANDSSPRPVSSSSAVVCKACKRSFLTRDFLDKHVCKPIVIVSAEDDPIINAPHPARSGKPKYKVLSEAIEAAAKQGRIQSIDDLMESHIIAGCSPVTLMAALEQMAYMGGLVLPEHTPPVRRTCSEPGCDGAYRARGRCSTHYKQAAKNGGFEQRKPIEHGSSEAAYRRHVTRNEGEWSMPACDACLAAHRAYNTARYNARVNGLS